MSSDDLQISLAEICTDVGYGYTESATNDRIGPKFLRITDIQGGTIDWKVVPFCPASEINATKYQLHVGDIVVARTGNSTGENAQITSNPPPAVFASYLIRFRPDSSRVNPFFVGYQLRSERFRQHVLAVRGGSAQPGANAKQLGAFPVQLIARELQDSAVGILRSLDDRITLLRETNATLEAIAQALFKSWFVDFDPVRAKMEGRAPEGMDEATAALFPDSFEESELGQVPKGWLVVTIGELCNVTIGGLWGKDTKENADLVPAICLRGVDLESLRAIGFAADAPVRWVKPTAMDRRRFSESEVLIASSGAGPCGRPLWAGTDFESIYGKPVIFSNFVKRLWCGSPAKAIFVDRLLSEMRHSREIWNYINGTSVPNLDEKLLLSTKKIVVPTNGVLESFEQIARAIYNKLYSQHAQTLTSLRDTLLPRLISGKLRLSEAENTIAEAIA